MHPLSSLSLWHRVVGLTLILIATLYIIDLTVVPIESKSQYFRFNPFSLRDEPGCSNDQLKSSNFEHITNGVESPKENRNEITKQSADDTGGRPVESSKQLSDEIVKHSADDTEGWPVQELLHISEIKNASVESREEHTTFYFHNSTWKPEIAQWLEKCGETAPILIPEQFANRVCEQDCRGRGVCNHELGDCRCYHGYTGRGCEVEQTFVCSDNETEEWQALFGNWRVSICGAYCDKRTSFCYCGEGTKYPHRPVAESCGFTWRDDRVDWNTPDRSIFSNDNERIGWCNLSIEDLNKFRKKPNCACTYDGAGGELCEIPVESFCINQCSGNGRCHGGSCTCVEGWHGIDCSIPSLLSSLKRWPHWLMPGVLRMTDVSESWQQETLEVAVERRRPLIYVYELPAKFNSHLLEGRHYKNHCATRIYDNVNNTIWIEDLYGSEVALLESLLSSVHRTANAEEADFFYVPVMGACAITRADEAPHMNIQTDFLGLRTYFSGELYREAYEYIRDTYPYWNQSDGRDHMWLFPWDEGACAAPKEIWNSMMLVHWGNTNSKYNYSTTGYAADSWNNIPSEWRGSHPCYDPAKDLVLPAWKVPEPALFWNISARTREGRPTLFYFNGNLGEKYYGRPEPEYSMGLRQILAEEFGSYVNKDNKVGRQMSPDVIVVATRSDTYGEELSQSRFCGVLPGDGWSGRMEDSILHGCIPVIIQDGIHLPFENVLNYNEFALRVAERDLPQLVAILRNVSDSRVDSMLSAIQGLWRRFSYINAVQLEAKREKQKRNGEAYAEWIELYMNASGDDAFSTFIQVLRFKLYNRTWTKITTDRDTGDFSRKDYCSRRIPS